MMTKFGFATAIALAVALTACGDAGGRQTPTPTSLAGRTPFATSHPPTNVPATTGIPATSESPGTEGTSPALPSETPLPTIAQTGETGIVGSVTLGPTCPVQRIDSPCPDRPYEATITAWRGSAKVAETRSDSGGHFKLLLEPGGYRVVGESPGTLPHGSEQDVIVIAGQLARVDLQYDSGIR